MRRRALVLLLSALALTACTVESVHPSRVSSSASALRPSPAAFGGGDTTWHLVALGDSISLGKDCPGCTAFVDLYSMALARRAGVTVSRTNWSVPGLGSGRLLDMVRHDAGLRSDLARADVVTVTIGTNDLPWNPGPDACGAAPGNGPVDWSKITPACLRRTAARYGTELDRTLSEIERLRAGAPTMLRLTGLYDEWIGGTGVTADELAIVARGVRLFDRVQRRAAAAHGATSADLLHVLNGPSGRDDAGPYLEPSHDVHPNQRGHGLIARALFRLGLAPHRD
jgi:lysophospholipase L1-like esterase